MKKKEFGQYYTVKNPFENDLFKIWLNDALKNSKNKIILEPFAGSNNIPKMLNWLNFKSYDKHPGCNDVKHRDTIKEFPIEHDIIITNPPYLEKSSAKRYGIKYNENAMLHRNLYLHCLELMLENAKYVAAIIPVSYKLRYKKHIGRIRNIIEFNDDSFFDDTKQEIVLALFGPEENSPTYTNGRKTKFIKDIEKINENMKKSNISISFNNSDGNIGFCAIESKNEKAHFTNIKNINVDMKISTRNKTKILINRKVTQKTIDELNKKIESYRKETLDFFTSSFYYNNSKRKRINYKIVRRILEDYYG